MKRTEVRVHRDEGRVTTAVLTIADNLPQLLAVQDQADEAKAAHDGAVAAQGGAVSAQAGAEAAAGVASDAAAMAGAAASTATNAAASANDAAVSAGAAQGAAETARDDVLTAAGAAAAAAGAAATSAGNAATSAGAAAASALASAAGLAEAIAARDQAQGYAAGALSSSSAAALSAGSANDARIATQDMMDQFANFRFLGKVEWWQGNPSMIPAGFLPMNGQLLNRADYSDIWEDVSNGVFPAVSDAVWLAGPAERAKFSIGNGATTFRLPDLNGVQSGSLKGLYLRGMGAAGLTPSAGDVLGDAIRNITGTFTSKAASTTSWGAVDGVSGAFASQRGVGATVTTVQLGTGSAPKDIFSLDASIMVPTADENRTVSAVGTWIMLVNGAPARQFNPETGAGLGSNTFGGLQRFNAGFEWVGVVPQLIQTDVEQSLTDAQKLRAASNIGAVVYGQAQALTEAQRAQARANIGFMSSKSGTGWIVIDGVYFAWGRVATPAGGYGTLTLPITFPNNFRQVLTCIADDAGASYGYITSARVTSKTTFYVVSHSVSSGALALGSPAITYLAIGD